LTITVSKSLHLEFAATPFRPASESSK